MIRPTTADHDIGTSSMKIAILAGALGLALLSSAAMAQDADPASPAVRRTGGGL